MKKKNIAFIVAHPDDETIGCGGTIYNLTSQKIAVNICFFSNGVSSRPNFKKNEIL